MASCPSSWVPSGPPASTSPYRGAVATRRKLPFDPVAAFVTVAMIACAPFVQAVHRSVPAKPVKEFIAVAKQHTLIYSSSGTGGSNHFATVQDGGRFAVEPIDHRGRTRPLLTNCSVLDDAYPDAAVGAGTIEDYDRLAETRAQLFRYRAALQVWCAVCQVRHD